MKRKLMISASLILLLLVVVLTWSKYEEKQNELTYSYDESVFHDFTLDKTGYVIFRCDITVKNYSNKKQMFTMKADVSKEIGLTKDKFAFAFKDNSDSHEVFEIAPNTTQTYAVKFKALSGDRKTKVDRLPPKEVIFLPQ
jgi:hypothetical protein